MPQAIRQSETSLRDAALWLPIERAAELMATPERTLRHRCAREFHSRGLAEMRRSGSRGRPTWFVHASVDPRLSPCPDARTREDSAKESLYAKHPKHFVDRAYRQAHWVREWRARLNAPRLAGGTDRQISEQLVADAKAAEGDGFKICLRNLHLWHNRMQEFGDDGQVLGVAGLVARYQSRDRDGADITRSPEAVMHFYSLYRAELKLSVTTCHNATLRESKRKDWTWPTSPASTRKWLERYDDQSETFLARYGKSAWSKKYLPHLEQDWEAVAAGEVYVTDHTQCDFWCTYKDQRIRPWLTAVQDCRSRAIVGWHLGPTPHQEAILLAMRQAFTEWGIPRTLRIDNGKDFTAQAFTGLTKSEVRKLRAAHGADWKKVIRRTRDLISCNDRAKWQGIAAELGIELIYAIPYSPWSKGTLERWFGTFEDQCAKLLPTYCGNNPQQRPESLPDILAGRSGPRRKAVPAITDASDVPTLESARETIAGYLNLYHSRAHQGAGMNGLSPREAWTAHSIGVGQADAEALAFLVTVRGEFKVGGNGVAVSIGGKKLTYGRTSAALGRYKGRDVLVAVDLERPAECFAFDVNTRKMIGRLEPNERMHPAATTDDVREAIAQIQRDRKVMRQAHDSSARRTRTASQLASADRAAQIAELKATGTDDRTAQSLRPVRTGFEAASKPARVQVVASEYDGLDLDVIQLAGGASPNGRDEYGDLDLDAVSLAPREGCAGEYDSLDTEP